MKNEARIQTTITVSDVTQPRQTAYNCKVTKGNVEAIAEATRSSVRKGAYEIGASAYHTKVGARLGSRQRQDAEGLKLEAKGNLARALYSAGWHSEQITWGDFPIILWWPK